MKARASASRLRQPPERVSTRCVSSANPNFRRVACSRAARSYASSRSRWSASASTSPILTSEGNRSSCGRKTRRSARRRAISPSSGLSSPERICSRVDLPEPFGPIKPSRSPGAIPNVMPAKRGRAPYVLLRLRQLSSGVITPISVPHSPVRASRILDCEPMVSVRMNYLTVLRNSVIMPYPEEADSGGLERSGMRRSLFKEAVEADRAHFLRKELVTAMAKKILAVDDERHILRLVQVNLERAGYTVVLAADGREALEKVASENPDLVVLDVMMPYMDGFEVLQRLQKDPSTRDLPVIMLTAKANDSDIHQGWVTGASCYLTKPFH